MLIVQLSGAAAGSKLYIIHVDKYDAEEAEPNGSLLSSAVCRSVREHSEPVSVVFLFSHGWNNDRARATQGLRDWASAMMGATRVTSVMRASRALGFRVLLVGISWPSKTSSAPTATEAVATARAEACVTHVIMGAVVATVAAGAAVIG